MSTRIAYVGFILAESDRKRNAAEWTNPDGTDNVPAIYRHLVSMATREAIHGIAVEGVGSLEVPDAQIRAAKEVGKHELAAAYLRSVSHSAAMKSLLPLVEDVKSDRLTAYGTESRTSGGSVALFIAAFAGGPPIGLEAIPKKRITG